ncbi:MULTISPECIES: glycosyltransferase [unclassified Helicobacter]|uniref:glycosyltransferase n=1 Tax=unclassified Helicobacter TaxID=2593540 RepID=UPI000A677CF9|nr:MULTISPECIES: glycosyltransferase [unclassified Helicobacter]
MNQPKISVITIVYNDVAHIRATMDSVMRQSYPHIEYILIDGASTDGTREAIESVLREITLDSSLLVGEYPLESSVSRIDDFSKEELENLASLDSAILGEPAPFSIKYDTPSFYLQGTHKDNPHFTFKFLSQKDSGIYDAMNKGIDLASGQWCNFMNCGDRFYTPQSIEQLFSAYKLRDNGDFAAIYGDTIFQLDDNHSKIPNAKTNPKYRMSFCHQGVFARTAYLKRYKFDTSFKICADNDFFTKIYNDGARFWDSGQVIAIYDANGVSSKPNWQFFKEELAIGQKYNRAFFAQFIPKYATMLAKYTIKSLLPKSISLKIQSAYNAK